MSKNAKNGQFDDFFEKWSLGQTALPDRSISKEQKLFKNANIEFKI